ncbi:hypothetical protein [Sorangium cellulosum]|uniref:Uncharacterized protein n=1 Tax=Sorangium cellulosum So0157-2 TaxID=1254432 RepID=S4XVE0_SORCE|nr:hypothetical protein [Sorangium cellulosum]AGP36311.1 hypothetical protein SCE1572_18525 [Sorangium cellulosum So0157-2]
MRGDFGHHVRLVIGAAHSGILGRMRPDAALQLLAALLVALPALAAACAPSSPGSTAPAGKAAPPPGPPVRATAGASSGPSGPVPAGATSAGTAPASGATGDVPFPAVTQPAPFIAADEAEALLFPEDAAAHQDGIDACRRGDAGTGAAPGPGHERVRCLLALRYQGDGQSAASATALFDRTGSVAGLEREHLMDGGYRGTLHLVPELPVRAERRHLEWTAAALADVDAFFADLAASASSPVRYRHRALALRYFRSVRARTPSAYASGWTVAYNLAGSLHRSRDAVRETLFHEIFHLNDGAHGGWSQAALSPIYDGIVARCGTRIPCLAAYAPNETIVKGGTYYAFQPGNGVGEYAAELAIRYYREQRAALRGERLGKAPFKCGPPENARAWSLLAGEFFGGADRVAPCPRGAGEEAGRRIRPAEPRPGPTRAARGSTPR